MGKSDDALHLLFLCEVRCVHKHGVLGLQCLHRIPGIPLDEQFGFHGDFRVRRPPAQTLCSAGARVPGICNEKISGCAGKHHAMSRPSTTTCTLRRRLTLSLTQLRTPACAYARNVCDRPPPGYLRQLPRMMARMYRHAHR